MSKSVMNIIKDQDAIRTEVTPQQMHNVLVDAFKSAKKNADPFTREDILDIIQRNGHRYSETPTIPGLKEIGLLEVLGAIGIFLTQFSDDEIEDAIDDMHARAVRRMVYF